MPRCREVKRLDNTIRSLENQGDTDHMDLGRYALISNALNLKVASSVMCLGAGKSRGWTTQSGAWRIRETP